MSVRRILILDGQLAEYNSILGGAPQMPRFTVGETVQYTSYNLSMNHGNIWKGNSDNTLKNNLSQ